MSYRTLTSKFWTGATGRKIRGNPEHQVLAAYLVTSPHANMIGVYYLPLQYIQHDTGLEAYAVDTGMDALQDLGFITYDADTGYVWVREMARHQVGETLKAKDNRRKTAERMLSEAPRGLVEMFRERYAQWFLSPSGGGEEGASKGEEPPRRASHRGPAPVPVPVPDPDPDPALDPLPPDALPLRVIEERGFPRFGQMSPKARVEIDRLAPVYEHELVAGLAECDRQDAVSWVYMARCIESYRRHLTATERRGPAPPGSPDDDGMEAYLAQFRGSP